MCSVDSSSKGKVTARLDLPLDRVPMTCESLNQSIEICDMGVVHKPRSLLKSEKPWTKLLDQLRAYKENHHILFIVSSGMRICKR